MAHLSPPDRIMITALLFGLAMTLLQRLTAPALGHTEGSAGFKATLAIWWLIAGLIFTTGLIMKTLDHHRRHKH